MQYYKNAYFEKQNYLDLNLAYTNFPHEKEIRLQIFDWFCEVLVGIGYEKSFQNKDVVFKTFMIFDYLVKL